MLQMNLRMDWATHVVARIHKRTTSTLTRPMMMATASTTVVLKPERVITMRMQTPKMVLVSTRLPDMIVTVFA